MTALDLIGPMQVLALLPGAEVQTIWASPGPVVSDSQISLVASHGFDTAFSDPDILIIGGAAGATLDVMRNKDALRFIADRGARATWVVSACTGSLILGAAGLLKGYRAASYWAVRDELAGFGAIPVMDRVVVDRNRMTGGGVTAGIDVGITLAGKLLGDDFGRSMELILEYAPAPPYGTGRPELAGPELTAQIRGMMGAALPLDAIREVAALQR
jgi:cyclohexyl-isocyanide hydratase